LQAGIGAIANWPGTNFASPRMRAASFPAVEPGWEAQPGKLKAQQGLPAQAEGDDRWDA